MLGVDRSCKIMQEEIFGPLLPVMKYRDVSEVIAFVNADEKPLAMYIFGKNRSLIDHLIDRVPSGAVLVNDTLFHFGNFYVPFGGIGNSVG